MARLVAGVATSHSPGMTGFPERADADRRESVRAAVDEAGSRLAAAAPDVIVAVSVEHFTNFFLHNLPAFAVCTGESFLGPATPTMAEFLKIPQRLFTGYPAVADAIYRHLLSAQFDPALVAGDFVFDENFTVPLTGLGATHVPVVPVVVNAVNPPYPSLARCFALGRAIAGAIDSLTSVGRVAVLATGGLSHWVGMKESGQINQAFDRALVGALDSGDLSGVLELTDAEIDVAGNGAHEIRSWVVLAGATGAAPMDVLAYEPVPQWLTGICVAVSRLDQGPRPS